MAGTTPELVVRGRRVDTARPLLMGIVNATPDSFSDGGEHLTTEARVALARRLAAEGATVIDIGGQSGITGVPEIPVEEEVARVLPVVAAVRAELPDVLISVDTYRPDVVATVLDAGADVVNDISGLRHPDVARLCGKAGAGLVVMHTRAAPKVKVLDDDLYEDVVADVAAFLAGAVDRAVDLGVDERAVIVDPGPDFAKTPHQTVEVLRRIDRVLALGRPTLLALSRKDFLGAITGQPPKQRLAGTLAAIGALAGTPGCILRVHEVREVADYLAVADVLAGRQDLPRDARLAPELRRQPLR